MTFGAALVAAFALFPTGVAVAHPVDYSDGQAPASVFRTVAQVHSVAGPISYTVVQGDTLSSLAQRFNTNLFALVSKNHIVDPNLILKGQVLEIFVGTHPSGVVTWPNAPEVSRQVTMGGASWYSVQVPVVTGSPGGYTGVWACIAQGESGGNPATNTGNGYYGGLQFTQGTWDAYGGVGNPADATAAQQQAVAQRIVDTPGSGGYGNWPNTSRACGV